MRLGKKLDSFEERVFTEEGQFPQVEASVRVLDTTSGRLVAGASLHRRGDDYVALLGLGGVDGLVALAGRAAGELIALLGN